MKKLTLISFVLLALSPIAISAWLLLQKTGTSGREIQEKAYIALEGEGSVSVINTSTRKVIKSIDLSEVIDARFIGYSAHNIQVSPDGAYVAVTANVMRGTMGNSSGSSLEDIRDTFQDKIVLIDPLTDTITASIPTGIDSHLAHVVFDTTSKMMYVTAQEKGKVYGVNLKEKTIRSIFDLGDTSQPHGVRLTPKGDQLWVALIGKKSMASIDLQTNKITYLPLSGSAIQTAVTPNGQYVFASVYETKKVAWTNTQTNKQGYIDLPSDAKGPVQLYPTPDSKYLYVADQGYYFDQPTSNNVYRIDADTKRVDQTINVGSAPHGVVVDKAGSYVYITNLLSNDVSIIDTQTNKEVTRIPVGEMPNGISIWNKKLGGTP